MDFPFHPSEVLHSTRTHNKNTQYLGTFKNRTQFLNAVSPSNHLLQYQPDCHFGWSPGIYVARYMGLLACLGLMPRQNQNKPISSGHSRIFLVIENKCRANLGLLSDVLSNIPQLSFSHDLNRRWFSGRVRKGLASSVWRHTYTRQQIFWGCLPKRGYMIRRLCLIQMFISKVWYLGELVKALMSVSSSHSSSVLMRSHKRRPDTDLRDRCKLCSRISRRHR